MRQRIEIAAQRRSGEGAGYGNPAFGVGGDLANRFLQRWLCFGLRDCQHTGDQEKKPDPHGFSVFFEHYFGGLDHYFDLVALF